MLTTKKRTRVFEFFLGIVMVALLAGCMPAGPKALLQGDKLLDQGKYAEAIPKLISAVEALPLDPQKAQAWNRLGLAYHQTGDAGKSMQAYQQALRLNRDLDEARFNLGCLQLEQGNAGAALEALTTYSIRQPQDSEGWLKLGEAQVQRALQVSNRERTALLDGAKKSFDQASRVRPSAEALNGIGMVHFAKSHSVDAVKSFQSALQMQPAFSPALLNLAIVYHSSRDANDRRNALKFYRDYLARNSGGSPEIEMAARQLEAELTPGARNLPQPSVATTNRTEAPRSGAIAAENQPRTVLGRYKYLSPSRPGSGNRSDANRFFLAGLEAQKAKRLEEAVQNYQKAIQVDASLFEAHYNLELVEFERGNLPAALREAELALAITAGSVNARYNFALALDKSGFAQDAANELEKILAQSPVEVRAHLLLGSVYAQKLNDMAKARIHFTKVLDLEPRHPQAAAIRNWLAANG